MTSRKDWHELPRLAAANRLIELRNELRQKNLFDTEEPPLPKGDGVVPPEARASRTLGWVVQRPRVPAHGCGRYEIWSQRATE